MSRLARQSKVYREPAVRGGQPSSGWGGSPWHALWRLSPGRMALYLEQLGELLEAGVTLHEAMSQLGQHTPDGRLRRMSAEIAAGASQGQSLAEQLRAYPQLVPPLVRGTLLAAERAGSLPRALRQLAGEMREQQKARWVLALHGLWMGLLLFAAVTLVPLGLMVLKASAAQINTAQSNETPVQYVLRVGLPVVRDWLGHVFLPLAALLVVGMVAAKLILGLPRLQDGVQSLLYRLPVAGHLIRQAATARFLGALNSLLQAGVEIQEALMLAAEATGNPVMVAQLQKAGSRVRQRQSLDQSLRDCTCLSRTVRESLVLAERAGTYEHSLAALQAEAEMGRRRTLTLSGVLGFGVSLLLGAVLVVIVTVSGYSTYFNTVLHVWDE